MWPRIVDKCPEKYKDKLSPDLIERAVAFALFPRGGKEYCVPITKEVKKGFGLKVKGGKYYEESAIVEAIADIVDAAYLQVRETVGAGIKDHLTREMTSRMEDALYPQIDRAVDEEMDKVHLELEHKPEGQHPSITFGADFGSVVASEEKYVLECPDGHGNLEVLKAEADTYWSTRCSYFCNQCLKQLRIVGSTGGNVSGSFIAGYGKGEGNG